MADEDTQVTTPEPPKRVVLEEIERLKVEALSVGLQNLELRRALLVKDVQKLEGELRQKAATYQQCVQGLAAKYGFNADETELNVETGEVIPRRPGPR